MDSTAPTLIGPRTGTPFSLGALDLAALGYREEEYFVSGTATAFRSPGPMPADGVCPIVPDASAAYTTRVLVRRPVDRGRFNGVLFMEWFNVSGGVDADVDWLYTHTELIRDGFGWVGVSAQHAGITGRRRPDGRAPAGGLQARDPDRYGALVHPGDDFSYDIFSQAGRAVREAMPGSLLIASGVSQSAYRLTTYINAVDPIAQVYDGFFVHSRAGACAPLVLPAEAVGATRSPPRPCGSVRTSACRCYSCSSDGRPPPPWQCTTLGLWYRSVVGSFMRGREIVEIAERHGWNDDGPGANHPYILKQAGQRPVPVRDKLENKFEAQGILKQLGISESDWPEKLK